MAVEINAVAMSLNGIGELFGPIIEDFNRYSQKNNLKIHVNLDLYTEKNSTFVVSDYESLIDTLIKKKNNKYELYFYDNIYSSKFGRYLLNLEDFLPKEHIDMYKPGIASQSCVYKKKWVGLVIIFYTYYYFIYYHIHFIIHEKK